MKLWVCGGWGSVGAHLRERAVSSETGGVFVREKKERAGSLCVILYLSVTFILCGICKSRHSHSILAGPLSGGGLVLRAVSLVDVSDLRYEWVIRVSISKQGADGEQHL